jgi:hypothetical protein
MTNLILKINNTITDSVIGIGWIDVDPINDSLIFSTGSPAGQGVSDGDALPSEALLNRYAVQLSNISPVTVPKYFLADNSVSLLKEIKLAGNQNKQYVFGCSFDGPTATEPQLEAWDNEDMDSYADPSLGAGVPSVSWYKAIATSTVLPGANWTGVSLAGNGASNIVLLNEGNGALTVADDLYFNFKIVIPAGYLTPAVHTPMLAIIYTTN